MSAFKKYVFPTARHSEPCEESKGIVVTGHNHSRPLGSFAALRMTGLEILSPVSVALPGQNEVSP
jgi:hypothetical protein